MSLFNLIPPIRWIELVVDGHLLQLERGYVRYENREPGAIEQALNALAFSIENRKTPLSVNHIKAIQSRILTNVEGIFEAASINLGQFRPGNERVCFDISKSRCTLEGLTDFLIAHRTKSNTATLKNAEGIDYLTTDAYQYTAEEIYNKIIMLHYCAPYYQTNQELEAAVESLIQGYHQEIAIAIEPLNKLFIIVKYIQRFEQLHPFFDGNGRTFINVLLNTLLISNHFYPAIFFEPNVFDLYSITQLVNVVIEGMWLFEYIALHPTEPLFYDHLSLPPSEQERLETMSNNLVKTLASITDEKQFILPSQLLTDRAHLNLLHVVTGNLAALQSLRPEEITHLLDENTFGKKDASVLIKNNHAIHLATRFGRIAILEWMLSKNKTLVNVANADGARALHFAASFSTATIVHFLLTNESDINQKNNAQQEACLCAAKKGTIDVFLALMPANYPKQITPAFFLHSFTNSLLGKNCDVIDQLCEWLDNDSELKNGIQLLLNNLDTKIKTLLNAAFKEFVQSPYTHHLRKVLTVGGSLFPPYLSSSIFEKTIICSKEEHFFLLVECGVELEITILETLPLNINAEWFSRAIKLPAVTSEMVNNISFLLAVVEKYSEHDDILNTLFAKGLNPYILDDDGSSILHMIYSKEINFLNLLKKNNILNSDEINRLDQANISPLSSAIRRDEKNIVEFFLANGANLRHQPGSGYDSIIEQTAMFGTLASLRLILEHLPDLDEAINSVESEHPLVLLLDRKKFEMADLFLEYAHES